ncbi:hypothetical protein AB0B79_06335 [Streptomyces sp. NPDC039022]|uniref:hypothetical protein n=1 Tax=unclassified Streptomyces TaxID=2593676 RepID=UPI0033F50E3D
MSAWDENDKHSAIRLLAVWVLLERSEQALSKRPWMPADSEQAEGGQLAGWPPAPAPCPDDSERIEAKRELLLLLACECEQKVTAQETRRIAELLEYLDRDEDALIWWQKAAARGDEDARDYLDLLYAETLEAERSATGLPEPPTLDDENAALYVWKVNGVAAGSSSFAAMQLALSAAGNPETSDGAKRLVREIEEYLQHPDRMTDGRRR